MEAATTPRDRESERAGFLAWLDEFWLDMAVRAVAHELSAEWHRRRGASVGVVAILVSAVVGTSVFAAATKLFDISGLQTPWQPLPYFVIFLAFLAPVLAAVLANRRDSEHADDHKRTSAGYYRLKQRLELWRVDAQWDEYPSKEQRTYLSQEREELFRTSATPSRRALRAAEKRLRIERRDRARHGERKLADEQADTGSEWGWDKLSAVASAGWLPACYIAAAIYVGRSPQPLGDRIGTLLIVGGATALVGAIWKPVPPEPRKYQWLYRLLPSPIGFGVLLVLLGNLLVFPSSEMQAAIVLWILLDLGWRAQWSSPSPAPAPADAERDSRTLGPSNLWTASLETPAERR